MKIKVVEQIVKNNRHIEIKQEQDGPQWLGDGAAFYPLHGFPLLDEDTIFRFFDIPEDKQGKYTYSEGAFPVGFDLSDNSPSDKLVRRSELRIIDSGVKILPLYTDDGVIFINEKYLAPFTDEENGFELYARKGMKQTLIAVKTGFLLAGLIAPMEFGKGKEIRRLAAQVKETPDETTLF